MDTSKTSLFWYQVAGLISALTPEGSTTDEGMVSPHGIKPLMKRSLVCIKPTVFFLLTTSFPGPFPWLGSGVGTSPPFQGKGPGIKVLTEYV